MKRVLDRIFGQAEEINGGEVCPTYLFRWELLRTRWFQVYLHHFVGDDWSLDMHDHPKRFISLGLRGGYTEQTPNGERRYRAPWLRSFPADHIHRLKLEEFPDCWTVAVVLKATRGWGFWQRGRFIPWRQYVRSEDALARKNCPGGEDL